MAGAFYEALGANIRRRRDAIGMTQSTLASRVGMLRTTVTNIERGRQAVLVHQLVDLAGVLGTDVASLLPTETAPNAVANSATPVPDQIQELLSKLQNRPRRERAA